jgi:hypothetical protein
MKNVTRGGGMPKKCHVLFEWPLVTRAFSSGIHDIRPEGQMWHMEAFNLAREAQNFVYLKTSFLPYM